MPIREVGRVHAKARLKSPPRPRRHPLLVARTRARLTRFAVALQARVNYATLWRIETGRVEPHATTAAAVAAAIRALARRTKKAD
jgi:DNA-binding XRE family transcriptional regulator